MVECAALERLCTSNRTAGSNPALSANTKGEVPEWLNGALSKSVVRFSRTAGSNPALSANIQEVTCLSLESVLNKIVVSCNMQIVFYIIKTYRIKTSCTKCGFLCILLLNVTRATYANTQ